MDISNYVTKKKRETSLMKNFYRKASKLPFRDKSMLRKLEMQMLRPKPIDKYHGPDVGRKDFAKRCVRVTFQKPDWVMRWMKLFRVNSYVEYNTWDVDFLMELIVKLETGRLQWNKKNNCYYLVSRDGKRKIKI